MPAKLWEGCFASYRTAADEVASGALAYFYTADTSTALTVYSDSTLATPRTQPVAANAAGFFPAIYLPYSNYTVLVTDASGVTIRYLDGIANPEPPETGGGGGITVSTPMVFQTGDVKPVFKTGTIPGFVRANGRTIGNALSGASERANDDCEDLYAYFWDNFTDAVCPVTTGRGATAAADFAAGKPIQVLSLRGRILVGADDMGNSAANITQVAGTITTTIGSASAVVNSLSGLAVGMSVIASTIPAGVTIAALPTSGLTITLSSGTSVTAGTTTACRFSHFGDAQVPGSTGGVASVALTSAQMPAHTHTGSVSVSGSASVTGTIIGTCTINDIIPIANGVSNYGVGSSLQGVTTTTTPNSGTVSGTCTASGSSTGSGSFTTDSTGNTQAHSNMQPSVVTYWHWKL